MHTYLHKCTFLSWKVKLCEKSFEKAPKMLKSRKTVSLNQKYFLTFIKKYSLEKTKLLPNVIHVNLLLINLIKSFPPSYLIYTACNLISFFYRYCAVLEVAKNIWIAVLLRIIVAYPQSKSLCNFLHTCWIFFISSNIFSPINQCQPFCYLLPPKTK